MRWSQWSRATTPETLAAPDGRDGTAAKAQAPTRTEPMPTPNPRRKRARRCLRQHDWPVRAAWNIDAIRIVAAFCGVILVQPLAEPVHIHANDGVQARVVTGGAAVEDRANVGLFQSFGVTHVAGKELEEPHKPAGPGKRLAPLEPLKTLLKRFCTSECGGLGQIETPMKKGPTAVAYWAALGDAINPASRSSNN